MRTNAIRWMRWRAGLGFFGGLAVAISGRELSAFPSTRSHAATPLHTKVTVDYRSMALADALEDLGAKAGVRLVGAPALLDGLDAVALSTPNYVAVHTDNRLFIADAGNDRIASVKLDYHTESRTALKDLPDEQTRRQEEG